MKLIFTTLLFYLLCTPLACDKVAFSYFITSSASCGVDPLYGMGLERTVTAVDLALNYINSHSHLFPAINLTYGAFFNTLECPITSSSLDKVFHLQNYGIFGYSCNEPAQQDFTIGPPFNFTPMINFAPTSAARLLRSSGGRSEQPALFSIHPTSKTYTLAILSFLREYGWQRLSIITDDAGFFEEVLQDMRECAPDFNVTLFESKRLATGDFLIPDYLRIVFMNMNTSSSTQVLYQASNMGYVFPDYIWITYSGNFVSMAPSSVSCNSNQLASIVDGLFTIETIAHDDREITSGIYADIISIMQNVSCIENTFSLSYYAVDAVLVLAQAINATLTEWSNKSTDWSFCEKERDTNMMSISRCFVRQKLLNTSIKGLTGEITFNAWGEREKNEIGLFQNRKEGLPRSVLIGKIGVTLSINRPTFELIDGENETTLFRGPAPTDSFPIKLINVQPLPLIIIYYTLASAGIMFCFICCFFNIIFRKRKIVKLTSPNLNYFIVLGAFLVYSSIYFRLYPTLTLLDGYVRCYAQGFLLTLGYVLCFAPVLMKMCRVFYIFRNPTHAKKAIKDWYLSLGTVLLVGIMLAMLMIGFTPVFKPNLRLIKNSERSSGVNDDGIEIENFFYQCYGFSPGLYWFGVEYLYFMVLQVAAFVLAIITRNVKIKALNDSKEMAIIVYTTTTLLLVLGVFVFALETRFTLDEILFGFGIMLATTLFLVFVFVPKMVDLYKDPRGEGIFGRNTTTSTNNHQSTTMATVNS